MKTNRTGFGIAGLVVCVGLTCSVAWAQQLPTQTVTRVGTTVSAPAGTETILVSSRPERDTLAKFGRPLTVDFKDSRLEDVIKFMSEVTGADLEPMWLDDRNAVGLNKEMPITLSTKGLNALKALEKILQKASEKGDLLENTWQMSDTGAMQIGPKERLNAFKRLEIYDISDLLLELPTYDNAPEFDLQSVLQNSGSGGGGGGGQSPFREQGNNRNQNPGPTREEKGTQVIDIITQLIETEQWSDNGGTGGTIRYYQGSLMVNAPDYMHRQINGYDYWPSALQRASVVQGRRWVSLSVDTAASTLDGLANMPVTAVVPGGGR